MAAFHPISFTERCNLIFWNHVTQIMTLIEKQKSQGLNRVKVSKCAWFPQALETILRVFPDTGDILTLVALLPTNLCLSFLESWFMAMYGYDQIAINCGSDNFWYNSDSYTNPPPIDLTNHRDNVVSRGSKNCWEFSFWIPVCSWVLWPSLLN